MSNAIRLASQVVSRKELCRLLEKAEKLGYPLGPGSYLDKLTIQQLKDLVEKGQHDA